MALRDNVAFRAVGFILVGLGLLAFGIFLVRQVMTGHSADTYYSAKMVRWSYGAALVTFAAMLFAAAVAWGIRFVSWLRTHLELKRFAELRGKFPPTSEDGAAPSPNTSLERTRGR